VSELAYTAAAHTGEAALRSATAAHNMTSLILSDVGLHDAARAACLRHFDIYRSAPPMTAKTATYALEPVVNLARLQIRQGDGETAYRLLDDLHTAVRNQTSTVIAGRPVDIGDFTISPADHAQLLRWAWRVHLAEGTRALATSGRWADALAHVKRLNGIGDRLLDGRQIAILADWHAGDISSALTLVDTTTTAEPWEHAVAACLRTLCHTDSPPHEALIDTMVQRYLALSGTPSHVIFRTRLGLTVLDLVSTTPIASRVGARLLDDVIGTLDGYAARDLLTAVPHPWRDPAEERTIDGFVCAAGLDHGMLSEATTTSLTRTLELSEEVLRSELRVNIQPWIWA
jgi:hypothetical protein